MASATHRPRRESPADEAWGLLHTLMTSQRRRFMAIASELDLHPAQSGALMQMSEDEPLSMHQLAANLHCDNSNVTGIVDRLEARGLVERRAHEHDRRVKQVVLTPLGAELRERIKAGMRTAPEALTRLSPADQRTLRDILRRALAEP
jgi:DNA-binding MarR family transcriptional regulator